MLARLLAEATTANAKFRAFFEQGLLFAVSLDGIKGARVLVIDDEIDARELLKRILEARHAVVTLAGSANQAVKLLQGGKFDVLVSDIGMPGEDGYSLI